MLISYTVYKMRGCVNFACILVLFGVTIVKGLEIRLWPVNARGNEGFVEVYHQGVWGLIGSPAYRFPDGTAGLVCRTLGLSEFGYSSGWTSIDNYGGIEWTYSLECNGNEASIDQCNLPNTWTRHDYSNQTDWAFRHGTRLFCVDAQIQGGQTQNTGMVKASLDGNTYALCYDGINMNAANVVCNHLGYDGALSIDKGEPDTTPIYNKNITCKGCEYSLAECDRSTSLASTCLFTAIVTCKAVRIARMSRYLDEGPVEVFHNGSWGFVGNPGFSFDSVTASYLCRRFGLSDVGFSTTGRSLQTYGRKAWLNQLDCKGNETDIMQCNHGRFGVTPFLTKTYRRGTWLYCFSFDITQIRLTGGIAQNEGRVELFINGRWGFISTVRMQNHYIRSAAEVICSEMGYSGLDKVLYDGNLGRNDDLFWMSGVQCKGTEYKIQQCHFKKGPTPDTYTHPAYLKIRCRVGHGSGSGPSFVG